MANILVTGGSGQIGSGVVQRLSEMFSPSDRIYLLKNQRPIEAIDERVRGKVEIIGDLNFQVYDFAFHLAAYIHTGFNQDPEKIPNFYRVNIKLTEAVADRSGRVLMTSTDNVFKGKDFDRSYNESDEPNPNKRNTYGITKAIAEETVLEKNGAVIRLQTVFGVKNNLIANRVFEAIDGKKDYWPFWDDTLSKPSYFEDLLKTAKTIYERNKTGVYHVSCNGKPLSRADIAHKVLAIHKNQGRNIAFQEDKFKTEKCNDKHFPRYLILETQRTQQELGIQFTTVDEALEKHVVYARGKTN